LKQDEKNFIVVVVVIIVIFVVVARINVTQTEVPNDTFTDSGVVMFNKPYENENVTTQSLQFLIYIYPTEMIGLYVASWNFTLFSEVSQETIVFNDNFNSDKSFTINEVVYLEVSGQYKAILSLDCYYKDKHYIFDTIREFEYIRN